MTPFDRRAKRALPLRRIARALREKRERLLEPREQRAGSEQARACGRELDRQRQPVESRADLLDGRIGVDLAADSKRPIDEKCDGVGRGERVELVFHLARQAQRRPARHEHLKIRRLRQQVGDAGRGGQQVLEVVEQQEHRAAAQEAAKIVARADRLRDLGEHQFRIRERAQAHPEHAISKRADAFRRDMEREARLARASRPGDGDEAPAAKQREKFLNFLLAPEQRARRDGKVGRVERAQRRELASPELEESLRPGQVLEAVLAEVANRVRGAEQVARRAREDDLAAVGG